MSRLTADTTQIKTVAGSALSQAARNLIMLDRRSDHDVRDERQTLGAHFHRDSGHSSAARGVRPPCPPPSRYAQDTLGDASAYAAENLAAHRTMRTYVSEKAVSERFGRAVERAFGAARQRMKARAALTGIGLAVASSSGTGHPPSHRRNDQWQA